MSTKQQFRARVREWAAKLDVPVRSVAVRPMQTKWASCSTAGTLTFSSDLVAADDDLQEYVIVHELLHLAVPNHGKLWKSLMRAHLGEYENLESRLKVSCSDSREAAATLAAAEVK